jgi:hypothetical protein
MCGWDRWFNGMTAPLRYDPSLRLQKSEAANLAHSQIDAGIAPEKVGIPNIGMPAPVPVVPVPNL